jgi:hypothetical protein
MSDVGLGHLVTTKPLHEIENVAFRWWGIRSHELSPLDGSALLCFVALISLEKLL